MSSPVVDATTTPLRGATTPLPDLSLPPPPRATATPTPGSTASSRGAGGAGSLLAYRNSLGSVSEREEVKLGGGGGDGGGSVAAGNEAEGIGGYPGDVRVTVDEGAEEESDAFGDSGMGASEIRALWDPTAFGGGDGG